MKILALAENPSWLAATLLPLVLAGCCAGYHNHSGRAASCESYPGSYETPLCFGYYSTCWRAWPEECPVCPPPTLPPPAEQVLPPPTPANATPTQPMEPMPGAAAPQPMPQPSAAPPATIPPPEVAQPSASEAYVLPPGEEGQLRRRWVEGGFVAQPASANLPIDSQGR